MKINYVTRLFNLNKISNLIIKLNHNKMLESLKIIPAFYHYDLKSKLVNLSYFDNVILLKSY